MLSFFRYDEFSGEEGGGKFLDLQLFYSRFINIIGVHNVYYHSYVKESIINFDVLSSTVRLSRNYRQYMVDLIEYLIDFAKRAHPLDSIDTIMQEETEHMKEEIHDELNGIKNGKSYDELLQELKGENEQLKQYLSKFCMKIGGTFEQRYNRLWSVLTTYKYNDILVLQRQVNFIAGTLLNEERQATVTNIQKKLSSSYQEIEQERKQEAYFEAHAAGENEREEEGQQLESTIYNPKDVPLGWDGKPIPYWMYKLHGLNHEFKCEVCGGAVYKGPRVFERHFTEGTHVAGLKRLGIAYSKSFMMITRIQDALQLHRRLANRQKNIEFDVDREVEVEDDSGNVMNLKTYNDLKRQGLV